MAVVAVLDDQVGGRAGEEFAQALRGLDHREVEPVRLEAQADAAPAVAHGYLVDAGAVAGAGAAAAGVVHAGEQDAPRRPVRAGRAG